MANIIAEIAGIISTLLAFDGTVFRNLLCDEDRHLQVDVLETGLPTGAATETTLGLVKDRIGALTTPASGSTNKLLTDALTALQLIDDLRGALGSVNTDDLQVDVKTSGLPTGAATETTLAEVSARLGDETSPASGSANAQLADIVSRIGALTSPAGGSTNKLLTDALSALQLIDNLYGALHSVNSDEMVVRGENQLFSYKGYLNKTRSMTVSAANGYANSNTGVAGEIWVFTNVASRLAERATTEHRYLQARTGEEYAVGYDLRAINANEWGYWHGWVFLEEGDWFRTYFIGAQAGDTCTIQLTGYIMTLEV